METSAFGYESPDGSVFYILSESLNFEDFIQYILKRGTPMSNNLKNKSSCLLEYFSDSLFTKDNSTWRVLYMLDGTVQCKKLGISGIFTYNSKPQVSVTQQDKKDPSEYHTDPGFHYN
jgi:hypothetical protein